MEKLTPTEGFFIFYVRFKSQGCQGMSVTCMLTHCCIIELHHGSSRKFVKSGYLFYRTLKYLSFIGDVENFICLRS